MITYGQGKVKMKNHIKIASEFEGTLPDKHLGIKRVKKSSYKHHYGNPSASIKERDMQKEN